MPRLNIQIDHTINLSDSTLSWLEESIPPILNQFGLATRAFVRNQVLPAPTSLFDDGTLHDFTFRLIEDSTIRRETEENGGWFVHVLITSLHVDRLLGIMYDFEFDPRLRQGCAIFANQIKNSIPTDVIGARRVLLRTIVHEIGHCLNLAHQHDTTLMAQTNNVAALLGPNWIRTFDFRFSQADIDFVNNFPGSSKPGGSGSRVGRVDDEFTDKDRNFRVSIKPLTDDPKHRFESGDAASLLVKVKNLHPQQQTIPAAISWNSQHCRVWLKAPRSKYRPLQAPVQGCGHTPEYVSLDANEQRSFTLSFFADSKGYLFNTPGTYKIKIAVKTAEGRFAWSRETSFVIYRPVTDSPAYKKMINSPQTLKRILLKQPAEKGAREITETIKRKRPKAGLTRVLLWTDFYRLKQQLHFAKNIPAANKLLYQLWDVCSHLYDTETSSLRKGKMVHELTRITEKLKKPFPLNKQQTKNMKTYQHFTTRSIKRVKPDRKLPGRRSAIALLTAAVITVMSSCVKDEIRYKMNSQVYGSVQYQHPIKGKLALPANQAVNVIIDNTQNPFSSFRTSEPGRYTFSPFREGSYVLEFSYSDTLLQYNASLVQRLDIDTLKPSSSGAMQYTGKTEPVSITKSNQAYQKDVVLQPSTTALKLWVTDEQNRPLSGVRVCLYANQSIAQQNAPYCGGAFAYLSSDVNGYILFTGLQAQSYYFNARGDFGVVHLSNQWSNDMKTAHVDKEGETTIKQVILK